MIDQFATYFLICLGMVTVGLLVLLCPPEIPERRQGTGHFLKNPSASDRAEVILRSGPADTEQKMIAE